MSQSNDVNEIFAALVKFQAAVSHPPKNKTVKVEGKTKAGTPYTYDFKYATFDTILDTIREPMAAAGLAFLQEVGDGAEGMSLTTTIVHSSGQWKAKTAYIPLGQNRTPQAVGSAITYFKRYTLTAALGLATDDDDDGNSAEGNQVSTKTRKKETTDVPKWVDAFLPKIVQASSIEEIDKLKAANAAELENIKANYPAETHRIALALNDKKAAIEGKTNG